MKLFKEYNIDDEYILPESFKEEIKKIEGYVLRHTLCHISTKNFNKECALLIAGKTTIDKEIIDKATVIGDDIVREKLKTIPHNKVASLILFWIELRRRHLDNKFNIKELKYTYSLEHVLPQKWEEFWNIDICPVVSTDTKDTIKNIQNATDIRELAIFELGNMTLLNSNLNSSLRNYEFSRKITGEKRKKGIKDYADLDIIKVYERGNLWNEVTIRERTNSLTAEFFEIW